MRLFYKIFIFLELGYLSLLGISWYKFSLNDYGMPPTNGKILLMVILLGIFLIITYSILYFWRKKIIWPKSNLMLYLGAAIFGSTLLAAWPMVSSDLFTYIMEGRILGIYYNNPYLARITDYSSDPLFSWVYYKWLLAPSTYGPLWAWFSALLAKISGNNLITNIFIFRVFAVASYLFSIYIFDKILQIIKIENKNLILYLYSWNPLLLMEVANNGHNDILMVALALLSLYLYLQKKYWLVLPVFILACLVKYIFILLLPFLLWLLIKNYPKVKNKIIFLSGNLLILIILLFITLWPNNLYQGLLASIAWQGNLFWPNFLSLLPSVLISFTHNEAIIRNICFLSFFLCYIILLSIFCRTKIIDFMLLNKFIVYIIGCYLLSASFLLNEWYILWLMPFILLIDKKIYTWLLLIITIAGMLAGYICFFSILFILIVAALLIFRSLYYAYQYATQY
jgi:hypothetical protein